VRDAFDVCVLVVNWNGGAMIRDLLRSIEDNKEGLRVQTIVVDNASTDDSANLIASQFPNVTLVQNPCNVGYARANNQAALEAGESPFLLLLNNDTRIRPGAMTTLVGFMGDRPDVSAVGPKLIGADCKPQRTGRNLPTLSSVLHSIRLLQWTGLFRAAYRRYRRGGFNPEKPGPMQQLAGSAILIRRLAFDECGGFDEGFEFGVEDVDLCARLKGLIYYLPSAEIEHLGSISSQANRNWVFRGYQCGWARYLRKYHGFAAANLYKFLVTLDMPIQIIILGLELAAQRIRQRQARAMRTQAMLRATTQFAVTSLPRFWRS